MTAAVGGLAALMGGLLIATACSGGSQVTSGRSSGAPVSTTSPTITATSTSSFSSSPTPRLAPPRLAPTLLVPTPLVPTRTSSPAPSASSHPSVGSAAMVIWRGDTSHRAVALTFDAGSDVGRTAQILDLLDTENVTATFGLTGAWMRANPAMTRRIVAAGHLVVNHTDEHLSFTGFSTRTQPLSRAERWGALNAAARTFHEVTGKEMTPWFRPPYGDRDASVDQDVGALGYRFELMWSVDSLGWRGVAATEVLRRVLADATPGSIVLMHVGAASTDAAALPAVIRLLRARSLSLVRADRL